MLLRGSRKGHIPILKGFYCKGPNAAHAPFSQGKNVTPGACSFVENFVHFMLKIKTHSDLFNFWKFRGIRANGFKCFLRGYI